MNLMRKPVHPADLKPKIGTPGSPNTDHPVYTGKPAKKGK